ncbi:MAG: C1 family peptidase [Runella zeae]
MKKLLAILTYLVCSVATAQETETLRLTGRAVDDSVEIALYPVSYFVSSPQDTAIDLSNYMPPVGYQGNQASCISWVVGYSLLGFLKAQNEKKGYVSKNQHFPMLNDVFGPLVPDIAQIHSPAYLYNLHQQKNSRGNCLSGMKFTEAFELFNQFSCPLYMNYPYTVEKTGCGTTITKKAYNSTFPHPNRLVFNTVEIQKDQIIAQLNAGRIVMVGLLVDDCLKNLKDSVWKPKPPKEMKRPERHALVCIGYKSGYFKMQNSWGTGFGKEGYFYLPASSVDTSIIKQLFVADYFPNDLQKATFSRKSLNNERLKLGEFAEGKAGIKYELHHIDKSGNAIITVLLPFRGSTTDYIIKKGETKAIRYTPQKDLFFTYENWIADNEIQFHLNPPQAPEPPKAKVTRTFIRSLSNRIIAPLPKKNKAAADSLEKQAFEALDKGKLDDALEKFLSADAAYSEFHSAYEAANKIRVKLKESGNAPTTEQKEQIKTDIKANYWFGGDRDKPIKIDTPVQNE